MAFTRYHDDPLRIMKQLQEFTDPGVYRLQVPGNGEQLPFVADPQLRLQKWGANRHNNFVQVESELWGMQHKLTSDCTDRTKAGSYASFPQTFGTENNEVTSQSRTLLPAWEIRSAPQPRWDHLDTNVQDHALIPFACNGETRISARDQFRA